jgi:hypothetical protein
MRILRHEAGHVLQHSYALHRHPRWRRLFGRSSTRYPNYYRPDPASRNFVQHLRLWYAQSHPDEDFAETFAVWLTPRSNWRKRYEGWPALKKLQYVDELMAELANRKPVLSRRKEVEPLRALRTTLGEHYQKKLEHYSVDAPRAYDRDLLRIFSNNPRHRHSPPAAAFIRHHRGDIRRLVSRPTARDHVGRAGGGADRASRRQCARRVGPSGGGQFSGADRQDGARRQPVAAAVDRAMKPLRVLMLAHPDLVPPDSLGSASEQEIRTWKTEFDVVSTCAAAAKVVPLGVKDELAPIRDAVESFAACGVQPARGVSRRGGLRPP